jgi:uncharacterized protein YggE
MRTLKLCGLVALVLLNVFTVSVCADDDCFQPRIRVTGDAEVKVIADEVILTLGVETSSKDLEEAKAANDGRAQRIMAAASKSGVPPKHIQTDYLEIEPRYGDRYTRKDFIGYFVRKTMMITLKDVSKFEKLLSDVLRAGANYVHGINFRTTELRKYRDQARALAMKAAAEKAADLAKGLGRKIGKPLDISETPTSWWSSYGSSWGSRRRSPSQNVVQNIGGPGEAMSQSLGAGQIGVNARIAVTFELE